jgi:hypothetical protein
LSRAVLLWKPPITTSEFRSMATALCRHRGVGALPVLVRVHANSAQAGIHAQAHTRARGRLEAAAGECYGLALTARVKGSAQQRC